ncbi:MAG TPA: ATP-binding cassette domain-containing protein [Anaerolineales bacterium]|nr:ATP-binding cassette domain-containing protein [Anaerolineales bacterium]
MNPLIEIQKLVVQRGGRDALQITALDVQRGETLAVVGPNGAGKSTLLLVLAKLIRPLRGQILFDGQPLAKFDNLEYRRKIAFVFQDPLLMDISVEENIALGLRFRGLPKEDIRTRVHYWLKQLNIQSLAGRRAGDISGGEAQRTSLARAFVLEPELLLLDEPFAALDPPTRASLLEELSSLISRGRRTAIFVTHNLDEAARLSQRIAIIVKGNLMQVGPAQQIRMNPVNNDVAMFLRQWSD